MNAKSPRWIDAEREHAESVAALLLAASLVPDDKWRLPLATGRWSPAQMLLHVEASYELGRVAMAGGPSMKRLTNGFIAWLSRTVLLPLMTWTRRFPRGAKSPREVVPDAATAHGLERVAFTIRFQATAAAALAALREHANRSGLRFTHAYFGDISPYQTLRLLNAHTRHHARLLAPPPIRGKSAPCVPELEQISV